MNLHSFTRAILALLIFFVFHYSIIVEAIGENDSSENKTISKKSRYQHTSYDSYIRKHDALYKENKNKHEFTKLRSRTDSWKLHQANWRQKPLVSVTRSTTVSQEKTPTGTYENNNMVKQDSSPKSTTKKSKPKSHRNRIVEKSKDSSSSEPPKTISTHHVPMASVVKSYFSEKATPTAMTASSKISENQHNRKDVEKATATTSKTNHATTTHDNLPYLRSLVPTGLTEKPKKTHHQDLGDIIGSKISSFFHPPKKTETEDGKSTKTHHFHVPRPSFLDPLFPHHGHNQSSGKETKTSTKTKEHTKSASISSFTNSTMISKPTTPVTPTTTSSSPKKTVSTASSSTTTTTHTTTSTSSQTISYTTRSFSVTSSTATPSLVLGIYDCSNDPHTINGKCDYEYFCNSATRQCVALANIGGFCYEDFQCASSYCENNQCVMYPGYRSGDASMSGGQIAGATVGSVAGATVVLLGLLGWRRRAQSMNRRIQQLKKSNDDVGFYTDYGIAPVNPTTTGNPSRESKYDFLNQMLAGQTAPAASSNKPGSPSEMSSIQDPWKAEDQEMTPERRYTFF
ncbi:hypothetical protein K501DRAFT_277550 [Backusella circina FSU 941]|nr:hypothetical protein K501DRAFT_277550 [Backusella circina FSU 941]